MSPRPEQPEPFIHGAPYPAYGDVPYPRSNPMDTSRLTADIWHAAVVPVGVRLEIIGDAEAVDIAYRTTTGNLGYRGDGAGITFSVWRAGHQVCEEEAVLGDGMIRLPLGAASEDRPATIYLPEGMQPLIQSLTPVNGSIYPAPPQPKWIAYGDSVTQGWIASSPAQAWPAIAARKAGLDLVNMGYAGAARGEIVSAEHVAELPADVVTISYGANSWTRIPHNTGMVIEGLRAFLDVVRLGHPTIPIVVMSPTVRPDAEDDPEQAGGDPGRHPWRHRDRHPPAHRRGRRGRDADRGPGCHQRQPPGRRDPSRRRGAQADRRGRGQGPDGVAQGRRRDRHPTGWATRTRWWAVPRRAGRRRTSRGPSGSTPRRPPPSAEDGRGVADRLVPGRRQGGRGHRARAAASAGPVPGPWPGRGPGSSAPTSTWSRPTTPRHRSPGPVVRPRARSSTSPPGTAVEVLADRVVGRPRRHRRVVQHRRDHGRGALPRRR